MVFYLDGDEYEVSVLECEMTDEGKLMIEPIAVETSSDEAKFTLDSDIMGKQKTDCIDDNTTLFSIGLERDKTLVPRFIDTRSISCDFHWTV